LLLLGWGLANFLPGLASNLNPPILPSQAAGIESMSHLNQQNNTFFACTAILHCLLRGHLMQQDILNRAPCVSIQILHCTSLGGGAFPQDFIVQSSIQTLNS
jgi:putative hemolysin